MLVIVLHKEWALLLLCTPIMALTLLDPLKEEEGGADPMETFQEDNHFLQEEEEAGVEDINVFECLQFKMT